MPGTPDEPEVLLYRTKSDVLHLPNCSKLASHRGNVNACEDVAGLGYRVCPVCIGKDPTEIINALATHAFREGWRAAERAPARERQAARATRNATEKLQQTVRDLEPRP
jgi:hypothetical protein